MILKSSMNVIFKFLNRNLYFLLLILKNVQDIFINLLIYFINLFIYKFYIY